MLPATGFSLVPPKLNRSPPVRLCAVGWGGVGGWEGGAGQQVPVVSVTLCFNWKPVGFCHTFHHFFSYKKEGYPPPPLPSSHFSQIKGAFDKPCSVFHVPCSVFGVPCSGPGSAEEQDEGTGETSLKDDRCQ